MENPEIRAAKTYAENKYDRLRYGDMEELYIDQRPALAWTETQFFEGEVWSLEYCAVVPYDDATYTVEFFATDPEMRNREFLREVVSTFLVAD